MAGLSSTIFVSSFSIMLIFNWVYCAINPNAVQVMVFGAITTFVISGIAVVLASSIWIVGSGLEWYASRVIFGGVILLGILFRIDIGYTPTFLEGTNLVLQPTQTIPLGVGLATNILDIFPIDQFFGIGFFIAYVLVVVTFFSGLIMLLGE